MAASGSRSESSRSRRTLPPVRTYVRGLNGVWSAIAPEVPGIGLTGHERWATREEAIERCRALVAGEIAAYTRLGLPLELTDGDEVVDWTAQFWLIPELLIPIRPAQVMMLRRASSRCWLSPVVNGM